MIILLIELLVFIAIILLFNRNNKFIWCLFPQYLGICLSATAMLLYSFKRSMYYHTYDFDKKLFMMLTQLNLTINTMARLFHFGIALIFLSNLLTFFIFTPKMRCKYALIIPIVYYIYVNNPNTNFRWFILAQTSGGRYDALFATAYTVSNLVTIIYLILPIAALIRNTFTTRIMHSKKTSAVFAVYFLASNVFAAVMFLSKSFINPAEFKVQLNEYFIPHLTVVNIEEFPKFIIVILALLIVLLMLTKPFNYYLFSWKNVIMRRIDEFRTNSNCNLKMLFHKYKNIFAAIEKFSQLGLQENAGDNTGVQTAFETIESISVESLADIRQIITSIDDELELKPAITNVYECMKAAMRMAALPFSETETKIDAETELSIYCDRNLLTEAISNILKNAFEASKSASDRKIALEIFNELNFVVINITDHGEGIDRHDLRHIFKPFFSTKTSGNNQGLGLAFTKKIINFHNGTIYVHSKKNCFTTFQIVLPLKSDTNKFFRRGNESYAF